MYIVKRQGQVIGTFKWFADAWVEAFLSGGCFCTIIGKDGVWQVNPAYDISKVMH